MKKRQYRAGTRYLALNQPPVFFVWAAPLSRCERFLILTNFHFSYLNFVLSYSKKFRSVDCIYFASQLAF